MCEPTMIAAGASALTGGISAIAGHNAEQDAYEKNKQAAEAAAKQSQRQLTLRQMQEEQAAKQSVFKADLEARMVDAQARVSAGESGVAGASVDAVLSDIERQRLMNTQNAEKNLQAVTEQLNQEKAGVRANAKSQINSVSKPNPWATALKIGGSTLEAAGTYYRNQPHVGKGD
jgi:hypothetical protein